MGLITNFEKEIEAFKYLYDVFSFNNLTELVPMLTEVYPLAAHFEHALIWGASNIIYLPCTEIKVCFYSQKYSIMTDFPLLGLMSCDILS